MKIKDQVINEFQSLGYEDAKLGRKLTYADYFILSESKRIVQNHFGEINIPIDNNNKTNLLITTNTSVEVENIFCTLLYHYEKGYLTYEYEKGKDKKSIPEGINLSALTEEIIDQYSRNSEFSINNLD